MLELEAMTFKMGQKGAQKKNEKKIGYGHVHL